jgi:hypothetical protein
MILTHVLYILHLRDSSCAISDTVNDAFLPLCCIEYRYMPFIYVALFLVPVPDPKLQEWPFYCTGLKLVKFEILV